MVMEVWLSSDSTFVIFGFRVIFRLTSRSFFCMFFFCGLKIEPACFVSFFRCSYGQIFRFFLHPHHNHKDVIDFFFQLLHPSHFFWRETQENPLDAPAI